MGVFDSLRGRFRPAVPKRYAYPTGNVELAMRIEAGEPLMAVLEDTKLKWTPGNEQLWDEYDPESLLDTDEKRGFLVNYYLFGRLTLYRALRAEDWDMRGRDPMDLHDQVPETYKLLQERFPDIFGEGAHPTITNLEVHRLNPAPGDPGIIADDAPGSEG